MSTTLKKLQERVSDVLPLLSVNLATTYTGYMNGSYSRGLYEYTLGRHGAALFITSQPAETLHEENTLKQTAMFFVDLRDALNDLEGDEKTAAQAKVDALRELLFEQGFTIISGLGQIPARPEPEDASTAA